MITTILEEIEQLEIALKIRCAELAGKPLEWEVKWQTGWASPGNVSKGPIGCIAYQLPIRLKPWTLGRSVNGFTLGEGQEWNGDRWEADMLPTGYRPAIKGETGSFEFLRRGTNDWVLSYADVDHRPVAESGLYRTIRPLPPVKPKYVPLGPEDVPPGSVFKPLSWDKIEHVNYEAILRRGVRFILGFGGGGDGCLVTWQTLMSEGWDIKRPGEDWQPCKKIKP